MKKILNKCTVIVMFAAVLFILMYAFCNIYFRFISDSVSDFSFLNLIFYALVMYGMIRVAIGFYNYNTFEFLKGAKIYIGCLFFSGVSNAFVFLLTWILSGFNISILVGLILAIIECVGLGLTYGSLVKGTFGWGKPILFFVMMGLVALANIAMAVFLMIFANSDVFSSFISFVYYVGDSLAIGLFTLAFVYAGKILNLSKF